MMSNLTEVDAEGQSKQTPKNISPKARMTNTSLFANQDDV